MAIRIVDNVRKHLGAGLVVVAGFSMVAPADAGGFLYRYRNAEGHAEISNSVPPERAPLGYEVLDAYSMRVVKVVDAQKSPQEIARIEREKRARDACQEALDRVNRLYQSEADIDAAQEQAIGSILTRIENAKVSLAQLQDQKQELQAEAARQERSGQGLNSTLRTNIDRANQQISTLEEEITKRHAEHEGAQSQFAADRVLYLQATCEDERAMRFQQAKAHD